MTKEQYINPECEKFTISGVDYYVHPSFSPIGVSMNAKVINVKTGNFKKLTAPKYAITVKHYIGQHTFSLQRLLAIAFIPNTDNFKRTGRKCSDDNNVSIENTVWTNRKNERSRSVVLYEIKTGKALKTFDTVAVCSEVVVRDNALAKVFSSNIFALSTKLYRESEILSSCGTYKLVAS